MYSASGDWLTSRPKGCSQPRELCDILMYKTRQSKAPKAVSETELHGVGFKPMTTCTENEQTALLQVHAHVNFSISFGLKQSPYDVRNCFCFERSAQLQVHVYTCTCMYTVEFQQHILHTKTEIYTCKG